MFNKKEFYVFGTLLGLSSVFVPGLLFITLCAFTIGLCIRYFAKEEDRRFILTIFITGLMVRIFLGIFLHLLSVYFSLGFHAYPEFSYLIKDRYAADFIGDSAVTSLRAWWLSQIWHGKMNLDWFPFRETIYTPRDHHLRLYAAFYYLFGFSQLAGKFINSLFSMGTAILVYYIAKDIFNRQVAKLAAIFSAFFPTIVLWSITDLKEPVNCFLFCLTIFAIQRLFFLKKIRYLFLLNISMANLFIRYHFGIFVLLVTLFSLTIGLLKNKFLRLVIILVICSIVVSPLGREKIKSVEPKLISGVNTLMGIQRGAAAGGGSTYKIYPDNLQEISSIKQLFSPVFIASLAKGLLFFLLTPFPWEISSKLQLLTYPQVILWYFLFAFALLGIMFSLRYYFKKSFYVLSFLFLSATLSGMASGNIGSALRHRDIISPLFLMFSSVGLVLFFSRKNKICAGSIRE